MTNKVLELIDALNKSERFKAERQKFRRELIKPLFYGTGNTSLQNVHTPYELCGEMIGKLKESVDFVDKTFLVLFNIEFVDILKENGVKSENIYYVADSQLELLGARKYFGIPLENSLEIQLIGNKPVMPDFKMKFDVVVGNPPYQAPKKIEGDKKKGTIGGDLWSKFVPLSLQLTKENGYVCLVHPAAWRKPEHELFEKIKNLQLMYLEIHGEKDGQKTFGATTRYDWYILKNTKNISKTKIKNEIGEDFELNIGELPFIPNYEFKNLLNLIAKDNEEKCEVLFSRSAYGTDKEHMLDKKNEKFKYNCVHSMRENGDMVFWYSSKKDIFFEPKVILNFGRYQYPYNDFEGKYGLTQIAFGLKISSKEEGDNIVKALNTDKFKSIIKATKWSSFQTEWRMFKYFRKDFWKEFI